VDKRFTTAANELVRLNASTLRETGRLALPGGVLAIVVNRPGVDGDPGVL
jgi:hypothetical protein